MISRGFEKGWAGKETEKATAGGLTIGDELSIGANEQASSSEGPVPPKHPPPLGPPPRAPVFSPIPVDPPPRWEAWSPDWFLYWMLEELKIALDAEVKEWTMIGSEDTTVDNRFFKCSWAFWNKTTVKEFADELT